MPFEVLRYAHGFCHVDGVLRSQSAQPPMALTCADVGEGYRGAMATGNENLGSVTARARLARHRSHDQRPVRLKRRANGSQQA